MRSLPLVLKRILWINAYTIRLISGSKICFLILYVNGILLATNDKGLLHEVKKFLCKNFDMKDMCNASYVISIKIFRDKHKGILGMSHETYINKVLERFWMKNYSPNVSLLGNYNNSLSSRFMRVV